MAEKLDAKADDIALEQIVSADEQNELSFRPVHPVDVSVQGLSLSFTEGASFLDKLFGRRKKTDSESQAARVRHILRDVSAEMPSGSLTAIIGASGSGKTSMLNALAERVNSGAMKQTGQILYNGRAGKSIIRSAYVLQDDAHLPTLTVRETLNYAAELRLPSPFSKEERENIVNEVIMELSLKNCADTKIGDHSHKGISGGERRRTSLAVQLLLNPSVLFLDEVTTGLDATTSFQLVRTLRELAHRGRTVILTIHQPRSEIWRLFDDVVILSRGEPIYSGETSHVLTYFEGLGHGVPELVNPAEFLIDLAAIDNRTEEQERISLQRTDALKNAWKNHVTQEKSPQSPRSDESQQQAGRQANGEVKMNASAPLLRQIRVLTSRTWKTTLRDRMGMAGSIFESVTMAVIMGLIFLHVGSNRTSTRSLEGAIYTAVALQAYIILLFETHRLTDEIVVYDRERAEGVVSPAAFLISRRAAKLLLEDIPVPLLFLIIFYFMVGFNYTASQFFLLYAIIQLNQYIAVNFSMMAVSLFRDFPMASLLGNISFTIQSVCGGIFLQTAQIPVYVRWLRYTAYLYYSIDAAFTNEFLYSRDDQFYDCPNGVVSSNPQCNPMTGLFVIESLGFPTQDWIWKPMLAVTGFAIGFYLIAWVVLTLVKQQVKVAKTQNTAYDTSYGQEQLRARAADVRTVQVSLDQYALSIEQTSLLRRQHKTISILKPISMRFEPGVINAILGASGSGKTSLLNMMAGRLHNSFSTSYKTSGRLLYNNTIPKPDVMRSLTSYVCQDDFALLPHLTAWETVMFAAKLRLPRSFSKAQRKDRANSVLLKLGLKDCANVLVGNEKIKGLSGGERRRLSIAIQILTDPCILLLDEPTSGLDSFTASSIMDVLQGLAKEGRTVILSIHQSRSDLFRLFDKVLLLAREGHPVYAGKGADMLDHFAGLGSVCPPNTNPADFALDLVTVDLQSAKKEQRSRDKVESFIASWQGFVTNDSLTGPTEAALPAEFGSFRRQMAPLRAALPTLLRRSLIVFRRNTDAVLARTSQEVAFGVILALFWSELQNDFESIQSRAGLAQETTALYFIGMLANVSVYPTEKLVFYREYADGVYSVEAFLLQYTLLEIPFEIFSSLIFACFADLVVGLPRTAPVFFVVAFDAFCIVNAGESAGIIFNTLFSSTGFAVSVISVFMSIATIMAGILSTNLIGFLYDLNFLSPSKYLIGNLAPYSLLGVEFTCADYQKDSQGNCPISTGEQVLELYNIDPNGGPTNLWALAIATVAYRFIAYVVLKLAKVHWKEAFGRLKRK